MKMSPMTNPAFAAYSKLTVRAHFMNELKGIHQPDHKEMSFREFFEAIQKNDPVSKDLSRDLPESQIHDSEVSARYKGDYAFEAQKLSYIKKAYELGIVDRNDSLIDLKKAYNLGITDKNDSLVDLQA